VISRSTFDLPRVLNTLLESAAHLCEADKGVILRPREDKSYYAAAIYRHTPEFVESQKGILFEPGRGGVVGRVLLEGKSVQIPDVLNDPEYVYLELARLGDFRTSLGIPLLREGTPVGILLLQRAAVRPFTDKQIELAETFADQAVIAIENTRLFEAEQQRTRELTESLDQQTATSEVLFHPGVARLKILAKCCRNRTPILYLTTLRLYGAGISCISASATQNSASKSLVKTGGKTTNANAVLLTYCCEI
jgi:two-component system, NtrC family, sensor kinase